MTTRFGSYVKNLRGLRSRKLIADTAGFSAEYLRQIEAGNQVPHKSKQLALAKALGVDEREFLVNALKAENKRAHEVIMTIQPKFAQVRRILCESLDGTEAKTVKMEIEAFNFGFYERYAVLLWTGALLSRKDAGQLGAILPKAKTMIKDDEFVETELADFMDRHLVSWSVDLQTGLQFHKADSEEVGASIRKVASETLSLTNRDLTVEDILPGLSSLLDYKELVALLGDMVDYGRLKESDRADIMSLWEMSGRLLRERLAASNQDEN